MSHVHECIVIGAGPAGLATSHELARRGVSHVVLERGRQVGQTWADAYDSLVLHTTRGLSALPGLAFPPGTPQFPSRASLLAYLQEYARVFSVPVRTGSEVIGVRRGSTSWIVTTATGNALAAGAVVVATGIASNPYVPELAGRERFEGRVMHSVDYRRPDPFAGKRVLIVGAGNSAADIASDLARAGVAVTLAVRDGATVVPLRMAGIPSQYFGIVLGHAPRSVQRAVTSALAALSRAAGRRTLPPRSRLGTCATMPIVGMHLPDAIRAGAVRVKGAMTELTGRAARFDDGTTLTFDSVILATGYRPAVGFLDGMVRLNSCGFPDRSGRVASADHPGLFFVGHTYDVRGGLFNIGRDAHLAASCVRSALDERRRRSTETRRRPNGR